jgi:carboxyl-terminal processing protease
MMGKSSGSAGSTSRRGGGHVGKASWVAIGAALGVGAATLASGVGMSLGVPATAASSDTYRQLQLFGDIFDKVRSDYVEKPDDGKLVESAINGMLTSLDPHSSYMDAKSFGDMQVQTRGEFGGLGIEVTQEDGLVKVVSPIDDTPAAKAGVLANDVIVAIDGETVQGMTLNQAVDKMRGPINTAVTLKIVRGAKKETKDVRIVRDKIRIQSVRSRVEGGDVPVIRITQFTEKTYDGLKQAIEKTKAEAGGKLKGYILDLRNNPGGLLDQSVAVADAFLDRGEIVSTRGRTADESQRYSAQAGDLTGGKPIYVLINGGSASASEIVAGALQDHKRATLVGTRSFGKGSVQTIIPIGQSGAIRLTTARYYTPSGRSIQAKGIEPDVVLLQDVPDELKGKDSTKGEASLKGHLKNGEDEKEGSQAYVPPDAKNDKQLNYALDKLRGVARADAGEAAKPAMDASGKAEAAKPDAAKAEAPKVEAPKVEMPKVETPKVETPKSETPKSETQKPN